MTNEELQAIKTRAEQATPGPWIAKARAVDGITDYFLGAEIEGPPDAQRGQFARKEDAEFIAMAYCCAVVFGSGCIDSASAPWYRIRIEFLTWGYVYVGSKKGAAVIEQIDKKTWAVPVSPLMHKTYANLLKVVARIPNHERHGWQRIRIDRERNGRKGCWWIVQQR